MGCWCTHYAPQFTRHRMRQWTNSRLWMVNVELNAVCDDTIQKRYSSLQPVHIDRNRHKPYITFIYVCALCESFSFRVIWTERKDFSSSIGMVFFFSPLFPSATNIFTSQVPIQISWNERKPIFQKNMQKKWNAEAWSWRILYYFHFKFCVCVLIALLVSITGGSSCCSRFELMKNNTSDVNDDIEWEERKTIHRCTIFTSTIVTRRQGSVRWAPTWYDNTLIHYYYSVFSMRHPLSLSLHQLPTASTVFTFACTFSFSSSFRCSVFIQVSSGRHSAASVIYMRIHESMLYSIAAEIPLFGSTHWDAHKRLKSLQNIPLRSFPSSSFFFSSNI